MSSESRSNPDRHAPLGPADPTDPRGTLREIRSSYRLKEGTRPGGDEGPGGVHDGTFIADWEYVPGAGDLDDVVALGCKTFPEGRPRWGQ